MTSKNQNLSSLSISELEKEKLISEIKNINKPIWKQPSFWTFLIAITATIYSWQSGLFETKSKILELKTIQLDLKRDTLIEQIKGLQKQKNELIKKNDSMTLIVNNLVTENEIIKRNIQIWKQEKQSKYGLQKDVLAFVKELKALVAEYEKNYEEAHSRYLKNNDWEEYSSSITKNSLRQSYNVNYRTKAIIFREKLSYFLPNLNIDRNTLSDYQHPTNPLGLEEIIYNLEYMAMKLTP